MFSRGEPRTGGGRMLGLKGPRNSDIKRAISEADRSIGRAGKTPSHGREGKQDNRSVFFKETF